MENQAKLFCYSRQINDKNIAAATGLVCFKKKNLSFYCFVTFKFLTEILGFTLFWNFNIWNQKMKEKI